MDFRSQTDVFPSGEAVAVAVRIWVGKVKTVSTCPPEGLFTQDGIYMSSRRTVHKRCEHDCTAACIEEDFTERSRIGYENADRAGKNLSASRRAVLERAKRILSNGFKVRRKISGKDQPRLRCQA
jgi:hypothetical protein